MTVKTEKLRQGAIVRNKNTGERWNVDQVLPNGGVLLVQRKAIYELDDWEEVDSYQLTGKGSDQ